MKLNILTSWKTLLSVGTVAAITIVACGSNPANSESTDQDSTAEMTNEVSAVSLEDKEANFSVKGQVENSQNELVFLRKLLADQITILDTVRTDDKGNYEFSVAVDEESIGLINIGDVNSAGVPIVLTPESKLKLDIVRDGDLIETKVKGDEGNEELKALFDLYMDHNRIAKDFNKRVSQIDAATASDSLKRAINAEYLSMQKDLLDQLLKFVNERPGSAASYFAASYIVQEPSMDLLNGALEAMKRDIPESALTKELDSRLSRIKPLDIGGEAPNIALKTPEGKVVELHSLRGNYVLIDFWASWCGPCRRENPNVRKVYQKYHDQGFEIYGVSLDNNEGKWKAAIQQDGLTWIHVSDLKGWQSIAAQQYQIHSIPATILLDKNGRIIAKNLRGAQLESKLEEIFN